MYLVQCKLSAIELVLEPQVAHVEVSQLAQACASGNSNCRAGVCVDSGCDFHSKIGKKSNEAESLGCAFGESIKLCFGTAQSDCCLGARPGLEHMCTKSRDATASTAASGTASSPR